MASAQYGRALLAAGRAEDALPVLEGAQVDLERIFGPTDARVRVLDDAISASFP